METLKIIFDYLLITVGIVGLIVLLYAIIAGTIKSIIDRIKLKKAKEDLKNSLDELISDLEKAVEEEKSKKEVKKTKKSEKSE